MKNFIATAITATSLATLGTAGSAIAQNDSATSKDGSTKVETPEIVERDKQGKATKVRINGKVVDVCMTEEQDNCINPRAAGLDFGDRPLDYWPGKTASSM